MGTAFTRADPVRVKLFRAIEAETEGDNFGSDGGIDYPEGLAPGASDDEQTPPDPDGNNISPEIDNGEGLDNDVPPEDDNDEPNTPPPGPLNVDLVYRKNELKSNKKENTKQYKQINRLLDDRADGEEPIVLDIQVAKDLKGDAADTTDDLEDDEITSTPDDLDSEVYTRLEYEDMSIESYMERFYYSSEVHYGNPASDELASNMANAAARAARSAARGAAGAGKAIGHGAVSASKAIGHGAGAVGKVAGHGAVVAVGALAAGGILATKKGIIALNKFWEKHETHFNSIEKQLAQLRKEVYLKQEIVKKSSYTNSKVLRHILNHDTKDIHQLFAHQMNFRKEFSSVVIGAIMTQKSMMENLVINANNKKFRDLTLKDFVIKNNLSNLFKPSHIEGMSDPLLDTLESKQYLMANKVILSQVPKSDLSTIEEYLDAMTQSKSTIYKVPESVEFKIDYLNRKQLLELIDLCLRFTRDLKTHRDIFNKMTGAKASVISTMNKFNMLSKLNIFVNADKDTKKEIKQYLDFSSLYVDRIYVDAFINMNNLYYNSLKYTIYFIKAHLTAKE